MTTHVDLWHVRVDAVHHAALIEASLELLAPSEQTRHARFMFDRHRHEYLVTRALARGVLSTYVSTPPRDLSFVLTEHGRPLLVDARAQAAAISFNLTNTSELVVCAVRRDGEIGVDAEPLTRCDDILSVATTVFTQRERARLDALPLPLRRRRAVELWTVKEAYIKARGLGMSLPVDRIEASFPTDGGAPTLGFFAPVEDAMPWRLTTIELEGHLVSLCVEAEADDLEVTMHRADLAALLAVRVV